MTGGTSLPTAAPRDHGVQFYRDDDELAAAVGSYLAEGMKSGDGVVVVATAPHRLMLEAALAQAGVDVARERDTGRLVTVDAAAVLRRFLSGDRLDRGRFRSVIAGLIRRAAAGGRHVRVYGEMVALLWDAGHVTMAIELEAMWNGLGALLPFSLLCGYPLDPVASGNTADAVQEVCGLHSDVIATRNFPAELDSVRAARHVTADLLDGECPRELAEDAAIVVTELASNAVLHAGSGFTLTISRSAAGVRIAVRDDSPLAPQGDDRPFDVAVGHGLSVVAQLARAWDVEGLPSGKVVWAELSDRQGGLASV
jgi:hypothetical protein